MDPVSHAIVGSTLVVADRQARLGSAAGAMAAVGALSPDVDLVVAPFGWDRYLGVHEIGTHSIPGALCCAAVAAALAYAGGAGSYRLLAVASGVGALSHLALDVLSGATIRLLWPFADTRFSAPLVAMADPWLAGILAIGFFVRWMPRVDRALVARVALAAATALLVSKAVLLEQAWRHYSNATAAVPAVAALPEAEWGSLTGWLFSDRIEDGVRRWHVDVRTGDVQQRLEVAANLGTEVARRSIGFEPVRHLRRTHEFVFASAQDVTGGTRVIWSDVRYCWNPTALGQLTIRPGLPQRPTQAPLACGLWFGGMIGPDGTLEHELVIVGDYVRERGGKGE